MKNNFINYKGFMICEDYKNYETDRPKSFVAQDVRAIVDHLGLDNKVVVIENTYIESQEERKKIFSELCCDKYKDCIIVTTACISTKEFPEDEYNDPFDKASYDTSKKDIDANSVLERESTFLKSLGFFDINFSVQYEYKVAFIFANEASDPVVMFMLAMKNEK